MSPSERRIAASVFVIVSCVLGCGGNQFDPHKYPLRGPFFEGWYMRIIDSELGFTFGLLFGHVLPVGSLDSSDRPPLAIVSILSSLTCPKCPLKVHNLFFNASEVKITIHNDPVVKNPDDASPSYFEWSVPAGKFSSMGNTTSFHFTVGNVSLQGVTGPPTPWGPGGEGPEGWLEHLPLPLHWFVYSLNSPVPKYIFQDLDARLTVTGKNAGAHLEKNWGASFPPSWIWVEALNMSTGVVLSLSGGIINLYLLNVQAFLIGYRNPSKKIVLNFTPADSITVAHHDGCRGYFNLTVDGLIHRLVVEVSSELEAFSKCLYGPEKDGFRPACVESYNALAVAEVYGRLEGSLGLTLMDRQVIHTAALEFGGDYVCGSKCNKY